MGRIPITFEGEGTGVGQPTWGHRELWGVGEQEGRAICMGGWAPLPEGTTAADMAAMLCYMMSRHQSLRTRFRLDRAGRLRQQVLFGSGDTALEVIDAAGADPATVARAVHARYEQAEFDCAEEWPVRMAAISADGKVDGPASHMAAVYNHLALDASGMDALLADLADRDPATGRARRPLAGAQPLEQARWQCSAAGRRQSDRALRHWAGLLRTIPARRFGDQPDRQGPQYRQLVLSSPAADLAVRLVSARTGLDTASVLLAAFGIAVRRLTGLNPTVAQVVVSNRFRPGLAASVSAVNQMGLCAIDTADADFDEVAARAWRSSLYAYKNAYYDPLARHELLTSVGRQRGEPVTVDCYYNDRRRRRDRPGPDPPPRSAADLRAALERGRLRWDHWAFGTPVGETFYLHIDDPPGSIDFTLCGNADHIPPADLEACARSLEEILADAAAVLPRSHRA